MWSQVERGKCRVVCHRKLEPDKPRASVSWRTLPREGGLLGPSALCALTGMWSRDREEFFLPPLHISKKRVQAVAKK